MIPYTFFMDLAGKDRILTGGYHGKNNLHLEARIMRDVSPSELEVAVSLDEGDVFSHTYDSRTHSLDILYNNDQPDIARIAVLTMVDFKVPSTIQSINIYDKDQTR